MNEQPPSGPTDHSRADSAAVERKQRLLGIRAELDLEVPAESEIATPSEQIASAIVGQEGGELNEFIKGLVDRRKQRKHQLEIIHDFFQNPVEFGVDIDSVPSGTTLEEIQTRKKELSYRIDLLRSVLEALEGELDMFIHAERSALKSAGDGSHPGAPARASINPDSRAPQPDEKR
jgi:hypothetical protein